MSTAETGVRDAAYWIASTSDAPMRPPLRGAAQADVAIVGGGIVGVTLALLLARDGASVVLVEAERLGAGVTGGTTGKVTALEGFVYADVRRHHGAEAAASFARGNLAGLDFARGLVREHDLACDWRERAAVSAVSDPAKTEQVEREHRAARDAGLATELVTEVAAPLEITLGLRLDGQAEFHARRYVLGLAALAEQAGARLHEGTRAEHVGSDEDGRIVRTADGEIRAGRVVLATHVPGPDRLALLASRYSVSREWVAGLEMDGPGLPEMLYVIGPEGTRSLRSTPLGAGRELLLVAGGGRHTGEDPGPHPHPADVLAADGARWYPGADHRWRWSAQDPESVDVLPMVGQARPLDDGVLIATAFRKWGLATGTEAARMLAARLGGGEHPWATLLSPQRVRASSAGSFAMHNLRTAAHLATGSFSPGSGAAELEPGQASVSGPPWRRVAAFRDHTGAVHAHGARCTHLGCEVRWNADDRSWDCPCHGSRFDAFDGSVLDGPADRPLPPA